MNINYLNLSAYGMAELSLYESRSIEGGINWRLFGYICGIVAAGALIYLTSGLAAAIL